MPVVSVRRSGTGNPSRPGPIYPFEAIYPLARCR